MKIFLQSMKKFRVLWIAVIIIVVMGFVANHIRESREEIVYYEALDQVIATVQGKEFTLRDFAVYVAFQEEQTQEQALIYDSDNTRKYWNTNLNGEFISHTARNTAMSMAIHDELFYQLSEELKVTLTEEELKILENDANDVWSDLVEEGKDKKLGITKEDVYHSYYKIACGQKAQNIYAAMDGVNYEDYDSGEEDFLSFLENYEYTIEESVLERLDFGDITLEH